MISPRNADHIFKCPSIYINSATGRNWKFYPLIYINQTNHQKKVCIILMLLSISLSRLKKLKEGLKKL